MVEAVFLGFHFFVLFVKIILLVGVFLVVVGLIPEGDPGDFIRVTYGCEVEDISEIVYLTMRQDLLAELRLRMKDVKETGPSTGGFYKGYHGVMNGYRVSVIDSRIGAPVASDCLYFLRFTKCKAVVYSGAIGGLQENICIGDIIVPTGAVRGEGASKYFIEENYPAVADYGLTNILSDTLVQTYRKCDVNIHHGPIFTTDSFASETPEFLEECKSRNLLGIEMETSVMYVLGGLFGMKVASFHVVSDNPVTKLSFFDQVSEGDKERRLLCQNRVSDIFWNITPRIADLIKGR